MNEYVGIAVSIVLAAGIAGTLVLLGAYVLSTMMALAASALLRS